MKSLPISLKIFKIVAVFVILSVTSMSAWSSPSSVTGKSYIWSKQFDGMDNIWEYTFLDNGQFVLYRWGVQNGHVINPQIERGAWQAEGDYIRMQWEAPGQDYGKQWVYIERKYKITDKELVAKSGIVHDTNKELKGFTPGREVFSKMKPKGQAAFKAYFESPLQGGSLSSWNLDAFKKEVVVKYPMRWVGIN